MDEENKESVEMEPEMEKVHDELNNDIRDIAEEIQNDNLITNIKEEPKLDDSAETMLCDSAMKDSPTIATNNDNNKSESIEVDRDDGNIKVESKENTTNEMLQDDPTIETNDVMMTKDDLIIEKNKVDNPFKLENKPSTEGYTESEKIVVINSGHGTLTVEETDNEEIEIIEEVLEENVISDSEPHDEVAIVKAGSSDPNEVNTKTTSSVEKKFELFKTHVKKEIILEVMKAVNEWTGNPVVDWKLYHQVNTKKKFYSFGQLPVEELKSDDGAEKCKVVILALPVHWGRSHAKALLALKTPFDASNRYFEIKWIPPHAKNKKNMKDVFFRIPTVQETRVVFSQLKRLLVLFGKKPFVRMDLGYKLTRKYCLFPITEVETKPIQDIESETTITDDSTVETQNATGVYDATQEGMEEDWDLNVSEKDNDQIRIVWASNVPANPTITKTVMDWIQAAKCGEGEYKIKSNKFMKVDGKCFILCPDSTAAKNVVSALKKKDTGDGKRKVLAKLDVGYKIYLGIILRSKYHIGKKNVNVLAKRTHSEAIGANEGDGDSTPNKKSKPDEQQIEIFQQVLTDLPLADPIETARYSNRERRNKLTKRRMEVASSRRSSNSPVNFSTSPVPELSREAWSTLQELIPGSPISVPFPAIENPIKQCYLTYVDRERTAYGLRGEYLQNLGLSVPLSKLILVTSIPTQADKEKLYEIFSIAGQIQSLEYDKSTFQAKIIYDHPIEAVQAISMFDNKTLFHQTISVKMVYRKKLTRRLPFGLESVGPGLGMNGNPISGVRAYIEMKPVQHVLADMGHLKPICLPNSPFFVNSFAYVPNQQSHSNINSMGPNDSASNLKQQVINNLASTSTNTGLSNPHTDDGNVAALKAILSRHGLIENNTNCSDLPSILAAIRENRPKVENAYQNDLSSVNFNAWAWAPTTSNELETTQNFINQLSSYFQQNMPNVQYNMPNVQHNVPNVQHNKQNMPNVQHNMPNVQHNVPNVQHNLLNVQHNIPNVQHNVPNVQHNLLNVQHNIPNVQHNLLNVQHNVPNVQHNIPNVQQNTPNVQHNMSNVKPITKLNPNVPTFLPAVNLQNAVPNVHNLTPNMVNIQKASIMNQGVDSWRSEGQWNQATPNYSQTFPPRPPLPQNKPEVKGNQNVGGNLAQSAPKASPNKQSYENKNKYKESSRTDRREKSMDLESEEEEESDLLLFSNLPPSVTIQALNSKMQEVGELLFGELTGKGRAIVRFKHLRDAKRCIKLFHRSKVDGRVIDVTFM